METQMPRPGGEGTGGCHEAHVRGTALPWHVEGEFLAKHESQRRQISGTIQDVLVE